jgi:CBS domain containing-hemolysin-like protein
MNGEIYLIFGLILLLGLDLLLIGTRTSYERVNQARLLGLREQMEDQVNRTLTFLLLSLRLRASMNLLLVLVRLFLSGGVVLLLWLQEVYLSLWAYAGVLLLSALILFGLEWAVERMVSRDPEVWAMRLNIFMRLIVAPLSVVLAPLGISDQRGESDEVAVSVTEDDLKTLVDASEEEGGIEHDERRMIFSIFQFGDTLTREIMVPRIDVLTIDVHTSLPDAVDAFLQSGHSRVPVHEETIDNILGLLYAKDLLRVWREGNHLDSLRDLLRPAYFVPEAKTIDELLTEMQSQRVHMAVVVDEYGGMAGLVTLEDIIEEIFGEIQDEYDQGEQPPYQVTKDGDYLFLGRVDLDDFNDVMGCRLPTDEADTLGGYIYSQLGHIPNAGESVQKDNLLLTVEEVSAQRIQTVRAQWLSLDAREEGGNDRNNR